VTAVPEIPDSASAATCAAIAQILPVFMVALVAERVVRRQDPSDPRARTRMLLATLIRIFVDLALAASLLVLTLLALSGVESEGLTGDWAAVLWTGTVATGFAVLYRWMLMSTPLWSVLNDANRIWIDGVFNAIERLGAKLPEGLNRLSDLIGRVVLVISEIVFGILSAGLFNGALSISEWLAARLTRPASSEKRKTGVEGEDDGAKR
jgi:hypothetical protein